MKKDEILYVFVALAILVGSVGYQVRSASAEPVAQPAYETQAAPAR